MPPEKFNALIPEVIGTSWNVEGTPGPRMVGHMVVPHCVTTGFERAQQLAVGYGYFAEDRRGVPGWGILTASVDPADTAPFRFEAVPDYARLSEWRGGPHRRPGDASAVRNIGRGLVLETNPDASETVLEVVVPILASRTEQASAEALARGYVRLNGEIVVPYASPGSLAESHEPQPGFGKNFLQRVLRINGPGGRML